MSVPVCRFCDTVLTNTFCDLGMSPPSNAYLKPDQVQQMEQFFPLHAFVCEKCKLVQLQQFQTPDEIFSDYAYFSSFSDSWLKHAEKYVEQMTTRLSLTKSNQVVEIASNDGYLLQYFQKKGIPVLGVEPAANVAEVARQKGVPSKVAFFGTATAKALREEGIVPDLLLGNNVLAHVPDLNDFVAGMKIVLADKGTITMEFPHVLKLMEFNQFDTIYHEHFSYFSLITIQQVFAHHGLHVFDVDEIPTHGGSLRIYARHTNAGSKDVSASVESVLKDEKQAGLDGMAAYAAFAEQVRETKRTLLSFLIETKRKGLTVVGYGAAAKGNTLLNYCGIRNDFLDYVVDKSPYKQNHFLPGTHIPIYAPEKIQETKPDFLLILPWNIQNEVIEQMAHIRSWGGKFVVPIPQVRIFD